MEDNILKTESDLILTSTDKNNLLETSRWGKFLGVVGFIMSGLLALVSITFMGGTFINPNDIYPGLGASIFIIYLVIAVIYVFPSLYVFRYSIKIKEGINSSDQSRCTEGFSNLKNLFLFFGIMTIIVLALYALAFLGIIAGGLMGGML